MKKYRIVGELADNGQSITKFKKEIKKAWRNSYCNIGTEQRYIKGINPIYNNSKLWYRKRTRQWAM